jgi:hypothetical protein
MSNPHTYETLTKALAAAPFRLGVSTAVVNALARPRNTNLRCRRQADGSVAVILEPTF